MVDGRGPFGADAGGGAPDGGFGRRPRGGADTLRRIRALAVLLLLVISGLLLRSVWRARSDGPPDALVEVQGAVPDPGIHALPDGASVRQALEAAGAGDSSRLADAAERLEDEIARILSGMSDLYAALLEAESGAAGDPTADLGEVMAWLSAEAEIARAAQEAEAMRPAKDSAAAAKQGATE